MKCALCGKEFRSLYYVHRHMRQVHKVTLGPLKRGPKSEGSFLCHYCGGNWTRKANLKKHLRLVHYQLISGPTQFHINCPYEFCSLKFSGTKRTLTDDVRSHIMKDHSVGDVAFIKKQFSNSQEFKDWKEIEERVEKVKFIQTRGITKYTNKTVSHLYCNRNTFSRKPTATSKHTTDLGTFCPAKITTSTCNQTGQVTVKYFNIHIAHRNTPPSKNLKKKRNSTVDICQIMTDDIAETKAFFQDQSEGEQISECLIEVKVENTDSSEWKELIEVKVENSDSSEWKEENLNDYPTGLLSADNSSCLDVIIEDGS